LDATPSDGDEETGRRCEKERHTNPVNFPKLSKKRAMFLIELEEESNKDGADA
jgi:hypothetical protein